MFSTFPQGSMGYSARILRPGRSENKIQTGSNCQNLTILSVTQREYPCRY
jgi:hypothetical protein